MSTTLDPAKVQSNGNDITFTTADGYTKLSHEIEKYDGMTGELISWVKVPTILSGTDTELFMYYGNANAADQQDITGTWNDTYVAVYHLHDDFEDSTSNNNDSTNNGSIDSFGHLADGQSFDGTSNYIDAPSYTATDYTYSTWIYTDSFTNGGFGDGSGTYFTNRQLPTNELASLKAVDGNFAHQKRTDSGGGLGGVSGGAITTNAWQYVNWGRDQRVEFFIYVDGSKSSIPDTDGVITPPSPRIGSHQTPVLGSVHNGIIDEFRILKTVLSEDWIATEYNNQKENSTFLIIGAEDSATAQSFGGTLGGTLDDSTFSFGGTLGESLSDTQESEFDIMTSDATINLSAQSPTHITKTSDISKDFTMVHFSDNTWNLLDLRTEEGIVQSEIADKMQMEFGGTLSLSDNQPIFAGGLFVEPSFAVKPMGDEQSDIKITGNTLGQNYSTVLLTITYPNTLSQNFITPVDEQGNYRATIEIDKMTGLGNYQVSASHSDFNIGSTNFSIVASIPALTAESLLEEKTNFIAISDPLFSIPSSVATSKVVKVYGNMIDYHRGDPITLKMITQDGQEFYRNIRGAGDGHFETYFNVTPEFPPGTHNIFLIYRFNTLAETTVTGVSPLGMSIK